MNPYQRLVVLLLTCTIACPVLAESPLIESEADRDTQKILRQYSEALSQLDSGFSKAVQKLQLQFAEGERKIREETSQSMSNLLDQTTKAGNLDAALRIRDAINAFNQSNPESPAVGCGKAITSYISKIDSLEKTVEKLQKELNVYRVENPQDASATYRVVSGAVQPRPFKDGQLYFTNRKYVIRGLEEDTKFGKFFPLEGGATTPVEIYITRPGMLYIAVAEEDEFNPKGKSGLWTDTGLRFALNSKTGAKMMIYMRDVPVGRMVLDRAGFACPTILVPVVTSR